MNLRCKGKEIYLNEYGEFYFDTKPGSILREQFPGKEARRFKLREEKKITLKRSMDREKQNNKRKNSMEITSFSSENVRLCEGMGHECHLLVCYDLKCRKRHSILRLLSALRNFSQELSKQNISVNLI